MEYSNCLGDKFQIEFALDERLQARPDVVVEKPQFTFCLLRDGLKFAFASHEPCFDLLSVLSES